MTVVQDPMLGGNMNRANTERRQCILDAPEEELLFIVDRGEMIMLFAKWT